MQNSYRSFSYRKLSLGLGIGALLLASAGCGSGNGSPYASEIAMLDAFEAVVNGAAGAIEALALQKPSPDAAKASQYAQELTVAIDASITEFQTADPLQTKIAAAIGDFGKVIVPDLPAGPAQVIVASLIPTVETLLKQLSAAQASSPKTLAAPHIMSAAGNLQLTALQSKNRITAARAQVVHAAARN
jgi:hypothetical protein